MSNAESYKACVGNNVHNRSRHVLQQQSFRPISVRTRPSHVQPKHTERSEQTPNSWPLHHLHLRLLESTISGLHVYEYSQNKALARFQRPNAKLPDPLAAERLLARMQISGPTRPPPPPQVKSMCNRKLTPPVSAAAICDCKKHSYTNAAVRPTARPPPQFAKPMPTLAQVANKAATESKTPLKLTFDLAAAPVGLLGTAPWRQSMH